MGSSENGVPATKTHLAITLRQRSTRRRIFLRRRRTKVPTLRLGGNKARRGPLLVRVLRSVQLRLLKLQYLKKFREYYRKFLKELATAGVSLEAIQQRLIMDASYAAGGASGTY
ncbi:hypothetical protein Tsubulata_033454 [Turnera subulata]|uniref:Uncharacterized protein n=1 Tax=Turnera subulata TaxID=218843 RepID=A0A9Q0FRM1_9ROSI|nr:hypothetical protein Tsubulata_033454 [Turnera subulata]